MSRARNYLNLVNFSRSYFKIEGVGIFETLYIAIIAFHALQCRIVCEGGPRKIGKDLTPLCMHLSGISSVLHRLLRPLFICLRLYVFSLFGYSGSVVNTDASD